MSKRIIVIAAACAAVGAFALGVRAETSGRLNFAVENDSGAVLTGLEVTSAATGGGWKSVALDHAKLAGGDSAAAHVARIGGECLYDVRARFANRASTEQDGVDLCDLDADTLVLKD